MSFVLSKVLWFITAPGNVLVVLLLLGSLMGLSRHEKLARAGKRLCLLLAVAGVAIAALPIDEWLMTPIENRFPPSIPEHVDGIILLGGDESPRITDARKEPSAIGSASRYLKFAALARQYPDAKLVFTGGSDLLVPYQKMKAADVARQILENIGVPPERMMYEDMSRNTHENAVFTADIVHPKPEQNWLLVTSAFHMPRSMGIFRKAGWNVFPAPTAYLTDGSLPPFEFDFRMHLYRASIALHEYVGLVAAWLLGYSDSPWPA